MQKKKSAGILMYRITGKLLEVLLVHPGGPFWAKKDLGSWSIPKGEFEDGEDALEAAKREFSEETGSEVKGNFIELSPARQKSGKMVYCWAVEGNLDPSTIHSNTFEMEWPPKSGKKKAFPEVDKGEWFKVSPAKEKILPAQAALIDELAERLSFAPDAP